MAPKWPQVNNGPEHINEHATHLREACHQLQAVDRGRHNQVPWNIVQSYITSTIALASKVLQQPAISEILHHVKDAVQCTQNIQRDVLVIKNSVGLSTAPPNAANFGRGRGAAASWAQVAAQVKGPPAPPPAPPNTHTKSQPAVTAYKDRAVTVKLKDHGVIQRFRTLSAARTRHHVETSIHDNAATKSVKVVAAHQLKSGDIQIFTSSTAEATKLKENRGWVGGLGEHAELIVPTYGVIVHGIATSSINVKDQKATIEQILADNYTVIPKADISFVGWLTRESPLKRASSIVVEFTDPEMANAIIYAGMAWDGQIHICQLYDRACRVKQCFRCYNYGHIGAQCDAAQSCGYCAELHETKNCKQKGERGFIPRCAVCKGTHTAWSNACPARKKELGRVEQAKQVRNVYWHVTSKDDPPSNDNPRTVRRQARNQPSNRVIEIPDDPIAEPLGQTNAAAPELPAQPRDPPQEHQAPPETMTTPVQGDLSVAEDWATPATQQETAQQQPLIDPRILAAEQVQADSGTAHGNLHQAAAVITSADAGMSFSYPLDGIEGEFTLEDADAWLANIPHDDADGWLPEAAETDAEENEPSPPTSMATETQTAQGTIYKACRCPQHQAIYETWPTRDANLVIAACMRICTYCGKDYACPTNLRKHMSKTECKGRNMEIVPGIFKKGGVATPSWTPREPEPETARPPPVQPNPRTTRSQATTDSTTATSN